MIWNDVINFLFPRLCVVCGERLGTKEKFLCVNCLRKLPYTNSHLFPENPIEKLYWYHIPIERAASYFFYRSYEATKILEKLKYKSTPTIGRYFARMMAEEYDKVGFFDGVDMMVPLPLAWQKEMKRGYNQCDYIAEGIRDVTGISIERNAVKRVVNNPTQTHLKHEERAKNVEDIFRLVKPERFRGKHVLIVDDVITTGSTTLSLAREINKAGDVKFSIVSLGYAGEPFLVAQTGNDDEKDEIVG